MYKILIIEDDEIIAENISEYLSRWNFNTMIVKDFRKVIEEFISFSPDLVLMDINLPHFDGYYFCRELRSISKTPIVFLSSVTDEMNIIMAMTIGADDFIEKPVKLAVLKAKIEALLRRIYNFNIGGTLLSYKGIIFDISKDSIKYENNIIDLTKNESKILNILFENREKIVSREEIMTYLWENDNFVDENTLSVNINRLRSKLKAIGVNNFIITKKGKGYII